MIHEYHNRQWSIIPIAHKSKNPNRPGWQSITFTPADFPQGGPINVGIHLGERSGWLVDIDLDHAHAVEMADDFLPPTPAVFGRKGKPRSHRIFYVTSPIKSVAHKHDGQTTLEIRADKGHQTVFLPSTHVSGEPIEWERWPAEPARIAPDVLTDAVERLHKAVLCRLALDKISIADGNDGSRRLFSCACRCVEHDLNDTEALAIIRFYAINNPFPRDWSDGEIVQRLRDAEKKVARGEERKPQAPKPAFKSADLLITEHTALREPIIDGMLRAGETAGIIAPPKRGKSWLTCDIAQSVATGTPWLGKFRVNQGPVLVIDNELHPESIGHRLALVAANRFVDPVDFKDQLFVESLRGRLVDIHTMEGYFDQLEPGFFRLIILDALYRFLPAGISENDNAGMAQVFNALDRYAERLGCAFLFVHHTSKGDQSGKSVTDVGSGAGSQSRAVDAHLVLREHQEPDCIVLDGAVRSWKPLEPTVLRWRFPVWDVAADLDPAALKKPKTEHQMARDKETDSAIQAVLFESAKPITQYTIRKETGFRAERVSRGIERGLKSGAIAVDGSIVARNGQPTETYILSPQLNGTVRGTPDTAP